VQEALAAAGKALSPAEVAQRFQRARASSVEEILEALVALGLARVQRGKYSP
jgi:DNA-binding IclR family transcriptional regulator